MEIDDAPVPGYGLSIVYKTLLSLFLDSLSFYLENQGKGYSEWYTLVKG